MTNKRSGFWVVALVLASVVGCGGKQGVAAQAGPTEVTVAPVEMREVILSSELPGRTTAYRRAEIRPQVTGIVVERLFEEGAEIKAGQQLYQIDDAPYKAAYATAKAGLAEAKANLAASRAREERYKDLVSADAISQQDYEDALAAFGQSEADIAAAKAAVESARINLQYTRVLAPIDGRIGKSSVTEGALVTSGQAQPLAVLQQLDPIYVDVSQSVGELINTRRQLLQGSLVSEGAPKVHLTFGDGSVYGQAGSLAFSEVDVNETTGTVVMRALFPNPDHLLLPGMFVRAEIEEGTRPGSLLVPQRAVTFNREGQATTLVVNSEGKVEPRTLQTGRALGEHWLVLSGLQAGEQVIVAGVQKVKPGVVVKAVSVPKTVEG